MFSIIDAQEKNYFSINRQEKNLVFFMCDDGRACSNKKNTFFSKSATAWKLLEKEIFIMKNQFSDII
jgi:predicted peptidase